MGIAIGDLAAPPFLCLRIAIIGLDDAHTGSFSAARRTTKWTRPIAIPTLPSRYETSSERNPEYSAAIPDSTKESGKTLNPI